VGKGLRSLTPPPSLFTSRDRDVTSGCPTGPLTTHPLAQVGCVPGSRQAVVFACS